VSQAADPGLLKVLEEQIVPRLLQEVPNQPSAAELAADPRRCRLTLIFDRAGYSPDFFKRMWALRIAVITYHKFPEGTWAEAEFTRQKVRLINGEETELELAERGVRVDHHSVWNFLHEQKLSFKKGRWSPASEVVPTSPGDVSNGPNTVL